MKTKNKIQFGILAELNRYNRHRSQDFDLVLQHMQGIDALKETYLKPFDREGYTDVEEMIDNECRAFEAEAKWIKALDATREVYPFPSEFYLVCYLTDKNGNPTGFEKIKQLFY